MRLLAAFTAHELRTQARSLRFRVIAALYVAASDLIPAANETKGIKMALWVFGGVLLFYGTEALLGFTGL